MWVLTITICFVLKFFSDMWHTWSNQGQYAALVTAKRNFTINPNTAWEKLQEKQFYLNKCFRRLRTLPEWARADK